MRTGVIVLQVQPWEALASAARTLDGSAADVVYVADHLSHPRLAGGWLGEGFTTIAAVAAVTRRIEVGTLVTSTAFRSPMTIARAAATVQDVAGGRFVLGLGSGTAHDVAVDGPDRREPASPSGLGRRYAETVEALDALWRGDQAWSGEEVGYTHAVTSPSAPGSARPFLLLSGHGPRSWGLVARHGDGWSSYGGPASVPLAPDDFYTLVAEQSRGVDRACEDAGRDPADLGRRSLLLGYGTVRPLTSVAAYVEAAERTREAGYDEIVVYWPDRRADSEFDSDADVLLEGLERVAAL